MKSFGPWDGPFNFQLAHCRVWLHFPMGGPVKRLDFDWACSLTSFIVADDDLSLEPFNLPSEELMI